ncbi:hypothetical protein P8452_51746 [Trifolium repens]|nr:hypothetical protein P8452_51746 [Trifolium repens]
MLDRCRESPLSTTVVFRCWERNDVTEVSSTMAKMGDHVRTHSISTKKATFSASDEDSIADVMEQHDEFISSMQNRSDKLKEDFLAQTQDKHYYY